LIFKIEFSGSCWFVKQIDFLASWPLQLKIDKRQEHAREQHTKDQRPHGQRDFGHY
jgi:hypothetical protein